MTRVKVKEATAILVTPNSSLLLRDILSEVVVPYRSAVCKRRTDHDAPKAPVAVRQELSIVSKELVKVVAQIIAG